MEGAAVDKLRNIRRAVSGKALFAVAVWGASFVATRIALEGFNPFGLVGVRLITGVALLVIIIKARGGPIWPMPDDVPVCVFLGVILGAHLLIQAYGLCYTSAINTGWIIAFIPVTIAIGAQLMGKQRLARIGWLGVVVATGGVLLVTMHSPPDFKHARFGDLLQLTSCLTWTVYTLAATGAVARSGALRVTTFAMVVAAVVVTLPTLKAGVLTGALTGRVVLATAFLGLVCSGVAYFLWLQGQHEHGPTRVGSLLYFEPFFTLAAAALLISEPVTLNTLFGGVTVLFGVWLVARGVSLRLTKPSRTRVSEAADRGTD
ncbi:MAG: DMT family transporter [Phycisphaerae bacterium]